MVAGCDGRAVAGEQILDWMMRYVIAEGAVRYSTTCVLLSRSARCRDWLIDRPDVLARRSVKPANLLPKRVPR